MTETEKIQNRINRNYTMAIYGTRENIHEQMLEDLNTLIIINEALREALNMHRVSQQRELLKGYNDYLVDYIDDAHCINEWLIDNYLKYL